MEDDIAIERHEDRVEDIGDVFIDECRVDDILGIGADDEAEIGILRSEDAIRKLRPIIAGSEVYKSWFIRFSKECREMVKETD